MGFTANITELDIRICDGDDASTSLQQQGDAYKEIVKTAFLFSPAYSVPPIK